MTETTHRQDRARTLAEWQLSVQDRPVLRYAGALVLSSLAIGARLWVDRTFGTATPFGVGVLAVTLSAFFFGAGPAILAMLVTLAVGLTVLNPALGNGPASTVQWVGVAVFVINGIAVAVAAGLLQKTLRARREAEREVETALRREKMARASAERAYEGRARLMARVSHELRTPLSPARMILRSALSRGDTAALDRADLELLDRSITAEMQLADELMEHSQLGAGKVRLNMKPTRGLEAVRRAIDTCIASDEWNGPIPVLSSQAPEEASVVADAVRFQQIVCNLLRNAGKFTPKDGEICVEAGVDLFNFVVKVRDTGVGISAEKLPHIFDEFEQGDHAAGRYGGMGLGLSIAQGLAKLHNGRIKASSEGTGKGAEFVLEIPLLGTDGSSGAAV